MDRKGQLTLYIILGMILLFGILLLSYYFNIADSDQVEKIVIDVPVQVHPINNFVTECVRNTLIDGIRAIGLGGGYADTGSIYINPLDPTGSQGLKFSQTQIPYWWHMESKNRCDRDCEFRSLRLPLSGSDSIETEIAGYIDRNLRSCVREYEDFRVQGFDVSDNQAISSQVSILDDEIRVLVDYPIKIRLQGDDYSIDQFYSILDLDLKRIYQLASDITNLEIEFTFLERQTMNIISGFSMGLLEDRLPPISEQSFKPGRFRYWFKSQTKDRLEEILMTYIPAFNVYGTDNANLFDSEDDIKQGIYRSFVIPSDSTIDMGGIEVNFIYLDMWPIYFDITGRGIDGEFIGPESAFFNFFSWLGMQRYSYYYDISYPVLVEIHDKDSLGGFRFLFALEVNVRKNKEINSSYRSLNDVSPMVGSLLCNHNQKVSNITLKVNDHKGEGDVQVLYSCGQESCFVGVTEHNLSDPTHSYLRASLPMCIGGVLTFDKVDYLPENIAHTSLLGQTSELVVNIEPYRYVNVTVMKKNLINSGDWTLRDTPLYLLDNEYAIVQLSMVDSDFSTYAIYYGNTPHTTIQLVPGTYELEIDLIYDLPTPYGQEKITIPSQTRCEGGSLFTSCEEITLPEIVFNDTFIEGGASFAVNGSDHSDLWVVRRDQMTEDLILYAIAIPGEGVVTDSLTYDDIEVFGTKQRYSEKFREQIEPIFR